MSNEYKIIKSCKGHYDIINAFGMFVSSADTMQEAAHDVQELLGKEKIYDTGGSSQSD